MHAGTTQRFEEAYRTIAERLGLLQRYGADADILRLVRNWLCDQANGRWLMVLDNADDGLVFFANADRREPLAAFVPQTENGSILVTSRSSAVAERLTGHGHNVLAVPSMDEKQALQLFHHKLGEEHDASTTTDVVHALGCLPLAISQAAAYIVRQGPLMSLPTYLTNFRRDERKKARLLGVDMGDIRRDPSAYNSIMSTWQMTFEVIQRDRPSAANLLSVMSFFSPQGIPVWVFRKREGSGSSDNDDQLEDDLDVLRGYSLVAVTMDQGMLEMHPMVQFCTQQWLSFTGRTRAAKGVFLRAMSMSYPFGESYENWATCRELDLHIRLIEEAEPDDQVQAVDMAQVLTNAAIYRGTLGLYPASERMLRKAVGLFEKALGSEHRGTLASVSSLGLALRNQAKYEDAERMLRRGFEGGKKALGLEAPETRVFGGNVGLLLVDLGQYDEAERILRWVLEGRKKALGPEHVDTLGAITNLGLVLLMQSRYEDAEEMYRRGFEGYKKAFGLEHPKALRCAFNLGRLLRLRAKYDQAEEMLRFALQGRERALGPEHIDTINSVHQLGPLSLEQGHLEQAVQLYDRAWKGFHAILGPGHPQTIQCEHDIAALRRELER